jgi:SAM-dependent methyltransferase
MTAEVKHDQDKAKKWGQFTAPIRPSAEDVHNYRSLMENPMKTLLLGSTPEIRSLAHQYKHQLTCVDISPEMYHILEDMVFPKGSGEFVCSDWLAMNFNAPFDLVVGDGSINMLPHQTHERFIENIARQLKPAGLFVLHVHLVGEPKFQTEEDVFKWYRGTNQPILRATLIHLYMLWIDQERRFVQLNVNEHLDKLDIIRRCYHQNILTEEEYQVYETMMLEDDVTIYFLKSEDFEHLINPYFAIESVLYAHDYGYAQSKPIYCLRKK